MFEKVNRSHPDKIADRIAGALVDLAYDEAENPKIAADVLIGHGSCYVVYESNVRLDEEDVKEAVWRITGSRDWYFDIDHNVQDRHLAENQSNGFRCGDNGIFMGCPVTEEQQRLTSTMRSIYERYPHDGKAVLDNDRIILCQSHVDDYHDLLPFLDGYGDYIINPLGPWTGGPDVDTGATNRKLGSDMGDSVTGGGLHGKDLSKADVSVNVYAWLKAQETGETVEMCCAIGDEEVDGRPYSEIVNIARSYITGMGGFEKFAEWGLV